MNVSIESITAKLIEHRFNKKKLKEYTVPKYMRDFWGDIELVPFCDKSESNGIIIFENKDYIYAAKYELQRLKPNSNGMAKSILCDFCFTLQPRSQTALITFYLNREKTKSVAHYCCADLRCSMHVRGLTDASLRSKSQIHEDIAPDVRIARFIAKTNKIISANSVIILTSE